MVVKTSREPGRKHPNSFGRILPHSLLCLSLSLSFPRLLPRPGPILSFGKLIASAYLPAADSGGTKWFLCLRSSHRCNSVEKPYLPYLGTLGKALSYRLVIIPTPSFSDLVSFWDPTCSHSHPTRTPGFPIHHTVYVCTCNCSG